MNKHAVLHISKRDGLPWYGAWAIRGGAILLALVVCAIVTTALTGENPIGVYKTMFAGAFGTKRKMWILGQNIAILLVVWLLLKPLDLAGKLPLVRTVNALGGALLGFIWAVLLLFAAVWLMQRFNWVVTPELIRDSILLKFFAENNPIGLIAAL